MPLFPPAGADRVLVVVAHPDDETLGCGATIARLADAGAAVKVLLPARREGARAWARRAEAFATACGSLGAEAVVVDPPFPAETCDSHLHQLHDVIEPWIDWAQVVFTHWHGDANQLHRSVARAVELATRPFRRRRQVLLFEIPSSTEQSFTGAPFAPNLHVRVDAAHAARKAEAMRLYPDELAPGRHPEDLLARLRVRGAEIGAEYAEAFVAARLHA